MGDGRGIEGSARRGGGNCSGSVLGGSGNIDIVGDGGDEGLTRRLDFAAEDGERLGEEEIADGELGDEEDAAGVLYGDHAEGGPLRFGVGGVCASGLGSRPP